MLFEVKNRETGEVSRVEAEDKENLLTKWDISEEYYEIFPIEK